MKTTIKGLWLALGLTCASAAAAQTHLPKSSTAAGQGLKARLVEQKAQLEALRNGAALVGKDSNLAQASLEGEIHQTQKALVALDCEGFVEEAKSARVLLQAASGRLSELQSEMQSVTDVRSDQGQATSALIESVTGELSALNQSLSDILSKARAASCP